VVDALSQRVKHSIHLHRWVVSPLAAKRWTIELVLCCRSKEFLTFWKRAKGDEEDRYRVVLQHFESAFLTIPLLSDPSVSHLTFEDAHYWDTRQMPAVRRSCVLLDLQATRLDPILACPCLDVSRLYCNHLCEVERKLDVHAAQLLAFREIKRVYQANDQYVNDTHLREIMDFMARRGQLLAFTRTGFNEDPELGFLKKMSFENILQHILNAAQYGDIDQLKNCISNVLIGKQAPIGTMLAKSLARLDITTVPEWLWRGLQAVVQRNATQLAKRLLPPPPRVIPVDRTDWVAPDYGWLKIGQTAETSKGAQAVDEKKAGEGVVSLERLIHDRSTEIVGLLGLVVVYVPRAYVTPGVVVEAAAAPPPRPRAPKKRQDAAEQPKRAKRKHEGAAPSTATEEPRLEEKEREEKKQ
jgi:hypothetical protein